MNEKKNVEINRVISSPEFWRIMGLVVGDNDTGINSFSNSNNSLIENCLKLGRKVFPSECVYEIKPKRQKGKKTIRRIRFSGVAGKIIKTVWKKLKKLLLEIDNRNFLEFITGLYEADGTITFRPSGKKKYLEVEIKLSQRDEKIAKIIVDRLSKILRSRDGVRLRLSKKYKVCRIRISNELDILRLFELINPIIRNPENPESFKETKVKKSEITCELFRKIKGKWKDMIERINTREDPNSLAKLYLVLDKKWRHQISKTLSKEIRKEIYTLLAKEFLEMRKFMRDAEIMKKYNLSKPTFYKILKYANP